MADATSKWHGRLQEGLLKISRRANSNEAMAKTSTRFDATSTVAFTLQVARMSSASSFATSDEFYVRDDLDVSVLRTFWHNYRERDVESLI